MTDFRALCAELLEAAEELVELMQGAINGDYKPDSFTLQPINRAMNRTRAALDEEAGVGPSDKELLELMPQQMRDNLAAASRGLGQLAGTAAGIHRVILNTDALEYARAVWTLATTHPRPTPVAERLPTEAECDSEGRCWGWDRYAQTWRLAKPSVMANNWGLFSWLPAAAIPMPEASP